MVRPRGCNTNGITRTYTYLLQETENRFTAQCNIDARSIMIINTHNTHWQRYIILLYIYTPYIIGRAGNRLTLNFYNGVSYTRT